MRPGTWLGRAGRPVHAMRARFLEPADLPALMALERTKWDAQQAASEAALLQRIEAFPRFSAGAFCPRTGRALASVFLCPIDPGIFKAPTTWSATMAAAMRDAARHASAHSLFGISLSSNHAQAVTAILAFLYPHLLKGGWRDIFLGSPIPGYRRAASKDPGLPVWRYVQARSGRGLPIDPQLRYYFGKGFSEIVSIHPGYFPHADSLDHGVILRGAIPFATTGPLVRLAPFPLVQRLSMAAVRGV